MDAQADSGANPTDSGEESVDAGEMSVDAGEMSVDAGEMSVDAGEMRVDAGEPLDTGMASERDSGDFNRDARVRPDLGFPSRDSGLPRFDGSLPSFDGSLPSFDGSLPMFDAGMTQTDVAISASMATEVWLNLMPIVSPDPIRAAVTLDYDNSGNTNDLLSVSRVNLLILVSSTGGPTIPMLFNQTFVLGPDYVAVPGLTTKTLNKVLGSAMPNMVMMSMNLCNQQFIMTLEMSNGQNLLTQGTTSCVF
jgi:hypothetical protein